MPRQDVDYLAFVPDLVIGRELESGQLVELNTGYNINKGALPRSTTA